MLLSNKLLLRIHEIRGSVGPGGHLILFQFAAGGGNQFDWKSHLFLGVFRTKDPRVFCWHHQGREQKSYLSSWEFQSFKVSSVQKPNTEVDSFGKHNESVVLLSSFSKNE